MKTLLLKLDFMRRIVVAKRRAGGLSGMRIVVTGADGFIGRNLLIRLRELGHDGSSCASRGRHPSRIDAGRDGRRFRLPSRGNQPSKGRAEFATGNVDSTRAFATRSASGAARFRSLTPRPRRQHSTIPTGTANARRKTFCSTMGERPARPSIFSGSPMCSGNGPAKLQFGRCDVLPQYLAWLPITSMIRLRRLRLVYVDDVVAAFIRLLDAQHLQPAALSR